MPQTHQWINPYYTNMHNLLECEYIEFPHHHNTTSAQAEQNPYMKYNTPALIAKYLECMESLKQIAPDTYITQDNQNILNECNCTTQHNIYGVYGHMLNKDALTEYNNLRKQMHLINQAHYLTYHYPILAPKNKNIQSAVQKSKNSNRSKNAITKPYLQQQNQLTKQRHIMILLWITSLLFYDYIQPIIQYITQHTAQLYTPLHTLTSYIVSIATEYIIKPSMQTAYNTVTTTAIYIAQQTQKILYILLQGAANYISIQQQSNNQTNIPLNTSANISTLPQTTLSEIVNYSTPLQMTNPLTMYTVYGTANVSSLNYCPATIINNAQHAINYTNASNIPSYLP